MSIEIPIKVNTSQIKDASKATDTLRQKLAELGSSDTTLHTRMDTNHAGVGAVIQHQNQSLVREIQKVFGNRGSISGSTYTSPGGHRYSYTPPANQPQPVERFLKDLADETSVPAIIGRAGKIAVAALGGMSLYNWWSNSKESASRFETSNAFLRIMGGGVSDGILKERAKRGSGPLEQAGIYQAIMNATGLQGKYLDDMTGKATIQGLLTGVGAPAMARYYSGIFPAVAERSQEKVVLSLNTAALRLHDAAKAMGAAGRYGEVLSLNQRILASVSASRGGAGLSDREISGLSGLQMALWNTGKIGQGASGVNILERLNTGILGGGNDPGSQIFFARALGIGNVKTLADLWKFKERQAQGASPENLNAVFTEADKIIKARGLSGEEASAMRRHFLSGAFPAMTPQQINAITRPEFRGVLAQLAGWNNKGAWSSILATARKQNPDAFNGMSEKDVFSMLGIDTIRADAEGQVTDLQTVGRPALRVANAFKDLKNPAKRALTDAIARQSGLFSGPTIPGLEKIDPRSMSPEELQNAITYMQGAGAYPDKLKELQTIQREQKGAAFTSGADLSYLPVQFASELGKQALTLRNDGGVMEITSRLDSLLSVISGNAKTPMKRWIQEGLK